MAQTLRREQNQTMGYMKSLIGKESGLRYPLKALYVCEVSFSPLEVEYDYDQLAGAITRDKILSRPQTMWRYRELLPIEGEPTVGLQAGFTPLVKADRLAKKLGCKKLYIKNDAVNYPTLSFKDRVVAVALSRAKELGFETVSCASTGNLANSVAANAAAAGLKAVIFIPFDLEHTKIIGTSIYGARVVGIRGTYDEVNRLCSEIANKYPWGFVNINLRPYYSEGSKTMGFEICEQLGWHAPAQVVIPMASGSLLTKVYKAISEFAQLGIIPDASTRVFGAQATGCSPISTAVKNDWDIFTPVKPNTIAKSLAIGNPADGYFAHQVINKTGGWAEDVSDDEIIQAIRLLAETEGIFAETAGGVTLGTTLKLLEQGRLDKNDEIVICITGNGLKTQEAVVGKVPTPATIDPKFSSFEEIWNTPG
jgi:threonine synthase